MLCQINQNVLEANTFLGISKKYLNESNSELNLNKIKLRIGIFTFYVLSYKSKTRINFIGSWWSGNETYFSFLLVASHALIQSSTE